MCQRRWNTFLVRTWKDRIATVRITFLTPSVFRFVMVPEMTAKSHRQTVVEDVPESEFETKNAEFTENEDLYIYETNQLSLHFSKTTGKCPSIRMENY